MVGLNKDDVESFKLKLSETSRVVLKGDVNYQESIRRWSLAAEKPAVGFLHK